MFGALCRAPRLNYCTLHNNVILVLIMITLLLIVISILLIMLMLSIMMILITAIIMIIGRLARRPVIFGVSPLLYHFQYSTYLSNQLCV